MKSATATPIEDVFHFCPQCGTPNETVGKIPFTCGNCNYACFFGPVAAVGALVTDDENRLLMVRRARDPGKGCWGLPGGFVDRGESIEAALAREVLEETRLIVTSFKLMVTLPNTYNYRGIVAPVIDLFYECDVENRDQIKLAEDELELYVWVRPTSEHLNNMAFPSNRIAIEKWLRES